MFANQHLLQRGLFAAALLASAGAFAAAPRVAQTNLVSDGWTPAAHTDPHLVNAWGISFSPSGPFWVSDNGTGLATVYDGTGMPQSLVVTIPKPGGGTSAPTGQVFNGTGGFSVTENGKSGSPFFIFASEDGTISGWSPSVDPANAVIAVDQSASRAVYKGLALYTSSKGNFLLATNFRAGYVEVYDSNYKLVRHFRDTGNATTSAIPFGYSPFDVAVLSGHIYVTYAHVAPGRHDDAAGPGRGFVDEVSITGKLLRRVASHGKLNSPWGLAIAPTGFGSFSGNLLVGNFGDGRVTAYNAGTSTLLGQLAASDGTPLVIDGLWGLTPGNGGSAGDKDTLYFSAGPDGEAHGLFGSLAPVK